MDRIDPNLPIFNNMALITELGRVSIYCHDMNGAPLFTSSPQRKWCNQFP